MSEGKFDNWTINMVDMRGMKDERVINLIEKLNLTTVYGDPQSADSIMHYGDFCQCDDGFLCEHRLQFIIDWLKETNLFK